MSIKQLKGKRHSIINRKSTNHTKKILNGGSKPKLSIKKIQRTDWTRIAIRKPTSPKGSPKVSSPPPQQLILGNQRSLPQTLLPSTQPRKQVFNVLKANQKIIDIGTQIKQAIRVKDILKRQNHGLVEKVVGFFNKDIDDVKRGLEIKSLQNNQKRIRALIASHIKRVPSDDDVYTPSKSTPKPSVAMPVFMFTGSNA